MSDKTGQKVAEGLHYPQLKVGEEPVTVWVSSDPYVAYSLRGFVPVMDVAQSAFRGEMFSFIVTAYSFAKLVRDEWRKRGNTLRGAKLLVKRLGGDRFAPYHAEVLSGQEETSERKEATQSDNPEVTSQTGA